MKPYVWGPFIWYLIHTIAYNIDDDDYFQEHKTSYFKFYESLKSLIPCPICRNHLSRIMKDKKLYECNNKNDLINWTILIHNKVNKKLKKPNFNPINYKKLYKTINTRKFFKGIDILVFNIQHKFKINSYIDLFESLKVVFPIKEFRKVYINAMENNNIIVNNYNTLRIWYIKLGKYISSKKS